METTRARVVQLLAVAGLGCAGVVSALAQSGQGARAPGVLNSCTTECHQDIIDHSVMHRVSEQKCDACHVQGNPKQHRFYFIVAEDKLCLRCHSVPHQGAMHTPVQQGRCMECHDPHGSAFPRSLRADPQRDLCLSCHTQDLSRHEFVHGPVAVGACIVCHEPHSSPEPGLLVKDSRSLCLTCHAEVQTRADEQGHMHGALALGCTSCHDPHASSLQYQLKSRAPDLCMSCHGEYFDQVVHASSVVHGAISEVGGCTECHEPHSSPFSSLQRGTEPELCLDCHNKSMQTSDGQTLTNMAALLAENPDHHGPIREGNCTACHESHAANHFRLLKEDYPADFYAAFDLDTFRLCFRCHISDLVLSETGVGLTDFRDGERNLHYLHVNREKGRTCRSCHEVHASKRPAHIREAVPFGAGDWMLPLNFQKLPDGGSCMPGCHEARTYSRTAPPPDLPVSLLPGESDHERP